MCDIVVQRSQMNKQTEYYLSLLSNVEAENIYWTHFWSIEEDLNKNWDPERSVTLFQGSENSEWTFGLASSFKKSINGIDRKVQRRILEALAKICGSPTVAQGNTIKPLGGDLSGFWRYRIGDYRLIYRPNYETKQVLFLEFGPRGSIYD